MSCSENMRKSQEKTTQLLNYWFKFGEIEKLGKNYINKCASDQWPVGETRATKGRKEIIRTEIIKYCFRISDYIIISFFQLLRDFVAKKWSQTDIVANFAGAIYALSRDDKSITCCVLSMIVHSNNRRL